MISSYFGDRQDIIFVLFYGLGKDKEIINVNMIVWIKIFEDVIHSSLKYLWYIFKIK